MKFLLFFILIICSFHKSIASCPKIDLNNSHPLNQMPIYDQGEAGICYAYAAAQLIDFNLKSKRLGPTPSGLALSSDGRGFFKSTLEGGEIGDIIESASDDGLRDYNCVSKLAAKFKTTEGNYSKIIHDLNEVISKIKNPYHASETEIMDHLLEKNVASSSCELQYILEDLYEKKLLSESAVKIIEKFIRPCPLIRIPEMKYNEFNNGEDSKMTNIIEEIMKKNKPAGLTFCSRVFDLPGKYFEPTGSKFSFAPRSRDIKINPCNSHAVIITGQRTNSGNGECEYLIRNSWGAQWNPGGFSCACRIGAKYFEDCPDLEDILPLRSSKASQKIEEDYSQRVYLGCWIKKRQLAPSILSVGSIE